ncbi:MAG TPA: DUF1592 domain-containing protein [Polyangiaceae bacterium]|nr:DUF1592 domain-containing protein [Polyangiaceae bacterium]
MTELRSLVLALVVSGCVGAIDSSGGDPSNGGNSGNGGNGGSGTNPSDPRLEARVWRLTPLQYNREVQVLFPGAPAVDLPVGGSEFGLTNIASSARIDSGNATRYNEAARTIGSWVTAQGAGAARCTTFGTSACVDKLLEWLPEAAYRRPPTAEEKVELRALYDELTPTYGAAWAFSALVRAVLLTPQFMYRSEIGASGKGVVKLDDYEIASLLAFALTDAGPDSALRSDAKAGKLRDAATREQHARRLMPRTTTIWQRFFWEWLKMSTLQSQGSETGLASSLVTALEEEYLTFVDTIVVKNHGKLPDLLTSTTTWAKPEVAAYYGVSHPGSGVAPVTLNPDQRGGLLTLGAWLVAHGKKGRDNVVRRGMGIYRDAMCQDIKPLNIDLDEAQRKLVGADATIKEIAQARSGDQTCGGCHSTSDPVGLSFESFAGDGRFQTTYPDGKPVEAAVVMNGTPYDNAVEVSAALAGDERFQRCLVQRFGHFVMGADFGAPVEVRASGAAYRAFKDSGGSFEELLVAIVRDPAFIERKK